MHNHIPLLNYFMKNKEIANASLYALGDAGKENADFRISHTDSLSNPDDANKQQSDLLDLYKSFPKN